MKYVVKPWIVAIAMFHRMMMPQARNRQAVKVEHEKMCCKDKNTYFAARKCISLLVVFNCFIQFNI